MLRIKSTLTIAIVIVLLLGLVTSASAKVNFDLVSNQPPTKRVYNRITTGTSTTETSRVQYRECSFCHTRGFCQDCDGTGELNEHITSTILRISYNDCCIMCEGTGRCPACEGTGYFD